MNNSVSTYVISIYLAGDYSVIKHACREYCLKGLCVTVERIDYIYTGGEESGVRVGLLDYPRFPKTEQELLLMARELALFLRDRAFQDSVMIVSPHVTVWLSKRDKNERSTSN